MTVFFIKLILLFNKIKGKITINKVEVDNKGLFVKDKCTVGEDITRPIKAENRPFHYTVHCTVHTVYSTLHIRSLSREKDIHYTRKDAPVYYTTVLTFIYTPPMIIRVE